MAQKDYIQDNMPDNVCFGCGPLNPDGLQIKSYVVGEECIAVWESEEKYHGWEQVLNGGILATLIDCHSMATALAAAYRRENRPIGSSPVYRFATGTITVRYHEPTPNDQPITLRARVVSMSGRKAKVKCDVYVDGERTADADVLAVRVFEGEARAESPFH